MASNPKSTRTQADRNTPVVSNADRAKAAQQAHVWWAIDPVHMLHGHVDGGFVSFTKVVERVNQVVRREADRSLRPGVQ